MDEELFLMSTIVTFMPFLFKDIAVSYAESLLVKIIFLFPHLTPK